MITKTDTPARPTMVRAIPLVVRWPALPGLALTLLLCGLLYFRPDKYPLRHLWLNLTIWALTGGLMLFQVLFRTVSAHRHRASPARRWRAAIRHPAFYCPLALTLWATLRWSLMLTPYAGRPWVIDLLWMGVAIILGSLLGVLDGERPAQSHSLFTWARRFMALAAILLGLQGCLQYGQDYLHRTLPIAPPAGPRELPILAPENLADLLAPALAWQTPLNANRPALLTVLTFASLSLFTRATARRWRWAGATGALLAAASVLLQGQGRDVLTLSIVLVFAFGSVMARHRNRTRYLQGAFMLTTFLVVAINPDFSQGRHSLIAGALRSWWDSPLAGIGPGLPRLQLGALATVPPSPAGLIPRVLVELGAIGIIPLTAWFMALIAPRKSRWSSQGENRFFMQILGREELWILLVNVQLFYLLVLHGGGPPLLFLLGLFSGGWAGLRVGDGKRRGPVPRPATPPRARTDRLGLFSGAMIVLVAVLAPGLTVRHAVASQFQRQGNRLMQDDEWEAASQAFARAARWEPDDPAHVLGQATALAHTARTTAAWPLLAQAAELDPWSAGIRAAQARWLADHGRSTEAAVRIGHALTRAPWSGEYRLFRAELELKKMHAPDAAGADLNELARRQVPLTPVQLALYNELARPLLQP